MASENSDTSLAAILERLKHCGEKILEFEVGWGTTIDLGEVKRTPSVPEQVKISIYPSESAFGVIDFILLALKSNIAN